MRKITFVLITDRMFSATPPDGFEATMSAFVKNTIYEHAAHCDTVWMEKSVLVHTNTLEFVKNVMFGNESSLHRIEKDLVHKTLFFADNIDDLLANTKGNIFIVGNYGMVERFIDHCTDGIIVNILNHSAPMPVGYERPVNFTKGFEVEFSINRKLMYMRLHRKPKFKLSSLFKRKPRTKELNFICGKAEKSLPFKEVLETNRNVAISQVRRLMSEANIGVADLSKPNENYIVEEIKG